MAWGPECRRRGGWCRREEVGGLGSRELRRLPSED